MNQPFAHNYHVMKTHWSLHVNFLQYKQFCHFLKMQYGILTHQHQVACSSLISATISDNNIGQWLPFPPYPMPNVVLQVQKNIERKVDIIVATLKEGKRGRAFVWGWPETFGWDCSSYQPNDTMLKCADQHSVSAFLLFKLHLTSTLHFFVCKLHAFG